MKAIDFKREGILYYIHKFGFQYDPEDTCSYKAQLILCVCLILATLHASLIRGIFFIIPNIRHDDEWYGIKNHLLMFLLTFFGLFLGHSIIEKSDIIPDFINWHVFIDNQQYFIFFLWTFIAMFIGLIGIALILAVIILSVAILFYTYKGITWLWSKIAPFISPLYTNEYGEPKTQLGVLYNSAKEKWCKRINWK